MAAYGGSTGGGVMRWFSNPQRDSRDDIRAAQQALVYAGHSRSEAVAEYGTYLYRLRAALAAPRDIVWAGFLVGAAMAVALTLALGVAGFVMGVVAGPGILIRPFGRGYDVIGTAAGSTAALADATFRSLLDLLPAALTAMAILGLAGAGTALVTRNRWRRAGALDTFTDLRPRRRYLLEAAAVWLGVAALIVLIVRVQAGTQMAGGAVVMLASFGIPVLASVFTAAFPSLYKWLLLRVSSLDAAAHARPIIELEAALRINADRDLYGRGVQRHSIHPRDRWADEVLARSDAARRRR